MNILRNISSIMKDNEFPQLVFKTSGRALLASSCAYGGTFFFTSHNPLIGATYIGIVALTSQVAYQILEKIKVRAEKPFILNLLTVIQLFQIPVLFYLFHSGTHLISDLIKLEIIVATAYFIAIPIFFHFGVIAWNKPTNANILAAVGVMLPLASGLRSYGGH